jgi:hypothetical protein
MTKKEVTTIDGLFSSKTRVKLLNLFFNNPGKAFYVREITRLIDEQINSVRRELSNMLSVGVIMSDSADNKLYYEVNQRYEHYGPFREIFAGTSGAQRTVSKSKQASDAKAPSWTKKLLNIKALRVVVIAGALVDGSASPVDLLIVGAIPTVKLKLLIDEIEKEEARELHYSQMTYDEFYYRLSVRDKFISEIINNKHEVIIDTDQVLDRV